MKGQIEFERKYLIRRVGYTGNFEREPNDPTVCYTVYLAENFRADCEKYYPNTIRILYT